ncbi:MAG: DNA replication and repair protein RecF [Myxococcales bacterium]|nr:DNA replication and repair protein RecF [Myxococcales bacterium]USN50072.1 MAG: DNA replication and repair protein RecF [Myxococcales bacterium]
MPSMIEINHNYIEKLFIKDFRNLKEVHLSFSPKINIIVGNNGHGKTNTLEAIAIACSLRPMQSLNNLDLINKDKENSHITAAIQGTYESLLKIDIFARGKKASLNEKTIRSSRQLHEQTPLVSFIPHELNMISGSSSLRRKALDQAASTLFFDHINALRAYEKLLTHRNRLLKEWPLDHESLKSFTKLFISEGARIINYRLKTIEQLEPYFIEQTSKILGAHEHCSLSYHAQEHALEKYSLADINELLLTYYQALSSQEINRRVSLFGPHLDNLVFSINEMNAQKCASRGQTRALVIAFKLAQMMAIFHIRGCAPIIILDDIVSELDAEKRRNLISLIAHFNSQAFFSATDMQSFSEHLPKAHCFKVNEGLVEKI